jgi:hypothetical protein
MNKFVLSINMFLLGGNCVFLGVMLGFIHPRYHSVTVFLLTASSTVAAFTTLLALQQEKK